MDIYFTLQSFINGSLMSGFASSTVVYISKDGGAFAQTTNSPSEIGGGVYKVTLTSTESQFSTLIYKPICTDAQENVYIIEAEPSIPTASENATAIWGASTRTLTASPTDISSLATASSVSALQTSVNAIPTTAAPTAQNIWEYSSRTLTSSTGGGGATAQEVWEYSGGRTLTGAVTLTSAYDPAKTAAQAGDAMTLTSAYDKAKTAAAPGDEMTLTSAYDASKTAAPTAAAVASAVWSETTRTITGIPSSVTDLLNQLHALLGDWTMGQTTLTTSEGNYTLTRDNDGNIIAVTPSSQGS